MEHSEFEREAMSGWGDPAGTGHDGIDTRHDLDGALGAAAHGGERLDAVATLDPPDAAEARTWDDLGDGLDAWTELDGTADSASSPGPDLGNGHSGGVPMDDLVGRPGNDGPSLPSLDELLTKLVSLDGSDLHLKVGSPPAYRIDGMLHFAELAPLTPADTADFADQVMPEHVRSRFEDTHEADFAYGKQTLGRFRVNCYRQRGSVNVVLRSVSPVSRAFEELGLPRAVEQLAKAEWGLVIVTGRAGSGKSTTVGAMLDYVNSNRRCNIITLEDPIELLHADKMSIVSQREIGLDTATYAEGMRRALRQDADVIFMGEMRDTESMEAALQAAETGKLVLTTMLTADAAETVSRIIEAFPPFQQKQTRYALAALVRGIICHRLVPRADGRGRVPAVELMMSNERVFERIADEGKSHLLLDAIVDGSFYGMQSFDQALIRLYERKVITFQDAIAHATDPNDFKQAAQAMGLGGQ
jgi:twitching motility protein PilT